MEKNILLVILLIVSFESFSQIGLFPSYTNINTYNIQPYYLSSQASDNILSDIRRTTFDIHKFNTSILMICTYIGAGMPIDMIEKQIDVLVNELPDWNSKLNFIAKNNPGSTFVYRVFDEFDSETFVVLFQDYNNIDVFPMDDNYKKMYMITQDCILLMLVLMASYQRLLLDGKPKKFVSVT